MKVCKIRKVITVLGKGIILVVEKPKNFQFKRGTLLYDGWGLIQKVQSIVTDEEFTNDKQVALFLADEVDASAFDGQENILVLEDCVDVARDRSVKYLLDDNIRLRARLRSLRSRCIGFACDIFDTGCQDGRLRIVPLNAGMSYEATEQEEKEIEKRLQENCPNVEWKGEGNTRLPYCILNGELCDTRCMWH